MTQTATHLIVALVLAQLIRDFWLNKKDKKKFPLYYVLLAGIAGLIPDLDVVAYWVMYFFGFSLEAVHRTFSHNLFVPLILIFLGIVSTNWKGRQFFERNFKWNYVFYILAFGVVVHLILDAIIAGFVMPFYPISDFMIGLNLVSFLPAGLQDLLLPSLDAAVLVLWLVYLEFKHKISSFI